jgi:predicted neuraminidase
VVYGARLNKKSGHWSQPRKIVGNPFRSLGNPVVWQGPDGLVWLFYVTRFGDTWSTSRIKVKISRDGAASWSDSALLTIEPGTMVRAHPIVLQTGEYLLPIYHETGHDTELIGPDTTSFFLRYNPSNKKWSSSKRIRSDFGNLQPAVAQVDDKHLIAYCRRGGGYEPTTEGYLIRSESRDGGHTWSKGTNSSFPNPNSAVDFIKLRSGRLLLVYNHNMNDRTPLTAALSSDNGKTFSHRMNIAEGKDSFAYPTIVQTKDGRIHVIFSSQGRSQINHAIFDENDLLSKHYNKKSDQENPKN